MQTPGSHLVGSGCPECGDEATFASRRMSTSEFIKRSVKIHGKLYSYDNVVYVKFEQKVHIVCRKHGTFFQRPSSHLKGIGCRMCGTEVRTEKNRSNKEEFVTESKRVHGNKYDYRKVVYVLGTKKVIILCKDHGQFEQTPANHLRGSGCPACKAENASKRSLHTTEQFIAKAKSLHGKTYNYDNVVYTSSREHVDIICKKHGSFRQRPHEHLTGCGCPRCKSSKGELAVEHSLRKLHITYHRQYTMPKCSNLKSLHFDFAVLVNGHIGLIEFQGEQHYFARPDDFFDHRVVVKRDKIKLDFCRKKRIPFLHIRYDEVKTVNAILKKFVAKMKSRLPGPYTRISALGKGR